MARFLLFLLYLTFVEVVFTMDENYSYHDVSSQVDCAGNPNNGCCLCNTIEDCKVSDPEIANCTDLDNGCGHVCVCTHPYTWDGVSCLTITKEYQSSPWSAGKAIVYDEYKLFGKERRLLDDGDDSGDDDDVDVDVDVDVDDNDNDGKDDIVDNDDDNNNDNTLCEPGYYSSSSLNPGSNSDGGINIAECKPCEVGYYQNESGMSSCIPCETGKFQDKTKGVKCEDCDVFCAECSSFDGSCSSCIEDPGIELKGDACVCKDGYYEVKENGIKKCVPCDPLCATCSGPSSSECDSCQNSLKAGDKSCVISCDSLPGYYILENSCKGLLLS